MSNLKNYREVEAVNNSLIKDVKKYISYYDSIEGYELKENNEQTEAMYFGQLLHEAIETRGRSLDFITYIEEDNDYLSLKPLEKEVVKLGGTVEAYCSIYDNVDTRKVKDLGIISSDFKEFMSDKDYKIYSKILDAVEVINEKAEVYTNKMLECFEKRISVLNNNPLVKNPKSFYHKLNNMYYSVLPFVEQWDNKENLLDESEIEIYFELNNVPCKSKIDRLLHLGDKVINFDYKTTSDFTVENAIKKYDLIQQCSFYEEGIKQELKSRELPVVPIEHVLVFIHKDTYRITPIHISPYAIKVSKEGGFYKPNFYTVYDYEDNYQPMCTEADIEFLIYSNIWSRGVKNQFKYTGWEQILNIIKENNLWKNQLTL